MKNLLLATLALSLLSCLPKRHYGLATTEHLACVHACYPDQVVEVSSKGNSGVICLCEED